jgi:hypothetical protein
MYHVGFLELPEENCFWNPTTLFATKVYGMHVDNTRSFRIPILRATLVARTVKHVESLFYFFLNVQEHRVMLGCV